MNRLLHFVCLTFCFLLALGLSGCCGRKTQTTKNNKKNSFTDSLKKTNIKDKASGVVPVANEFGDDLDIDLIGKIPLSSQNEHTKELYEKLNYANKMYRNRNYDSALREIGRIQQEVNNDPYLEMQTWALSAMIYDKTGKNSRRKRSYTKMLEAIEEVKKDSRYKKAYKDGVECGSFIASIAKKGDKKYDVYK